MVAIYDHGRGSRGDKATLPEGAEAGPPQARLTLDRKTLDRLRSLPGPGESYSDVILRLAG